MVARCCAYGCSQPSDPKSGITLHKFPRDPLRRKLWTLNVRRKNFYPNNFSNICSKHFEKECFNQDKFGGTWLKSTAIPTIFNFPLHLQPKKLMRSPSSSERLYVQDISRKILDDHESAASTSSKPAEITLKNDLSYLCDSKYAGSNSPTKLETANEFTKKQKMEVFYPQKIDERKEWKMVVLSVILQELEAKELISAEAKYTLETSGITDEMLKRCSNAQKEKYRSELRFFALTLHNYSPKGYNYVRNTFDTCLPHPNTLRDWYKNVMTSIFKGAPVPEAKIKARALNMSVLRSKLMCKN